MSGLHSSPTSQGGLAFNREFLLHVVLCTSPTLEKLLSVLFYDKQSSYEQQGNPRSNF